MKIIIAIILVLLIRGLRRGSVYIGRNREKYDAASTGIWLR